MTKQAQQTAPSNGQHPIAQQIAVLQAKRQQSSNVPSTSKSVNQQSNNKSKKTYVPVWTGFLGKTLWDWLQLLAALAVPLAVAAGTIWFSYQQNLTSLQLSDKQHQSDQRIADGNRQNDRQIANDQQNEATLQAYLDHMQDLLLNYNLRKSQVDDEVRQIARARTLTALRVLDPYRKGALLRFLYGEKLIIQIKIITKSRSAQIVPAVVDLNGADLNSAELSNAGLNSVDLSGVDLSGADLSGADLSDADLSNANLSNANLRDTILGGANLSNVKLDKAKL